MATIYEKLEYRKQFVIGIEELAKPSTEPLWKRIYRGIIETSINADIRLIGAWVAYHEGVDRALCHAIWPSRGNYYALVDTEGRKRIVTVVDTHDHRMGVKQK
jgi:hypothetical protein